MSEIVRDIYSVRGQFPRNSRAWTTHRSKQFSGKQNTGRNTYTFPLNVLMGSKKSSIYTALGNPTETKSPPKLYQPTCTDNECQHVPNFEHRFDIDLF